MGEGGLGLYLLGVSASVLLPPRGTHLTLYPSFRLLFDKGINRAVLDFPEQNHTEGWVVQFRVYRKSLKSFLMDLS